MEPDFSGYATRNGLKCSDGRTIMGGAFKHNDKQRVPLMWQHLHNDPTNVLGHAILEDREDGVYAYAFFNDTEKAKVAKEAVYHGDVEALSIHANGLTQQGKNVLHGNIREVSLVLAGANPGAFIDNVNIRHGDGDLTELDDEAIIYTGLPIELAHAEKSGDTVATDTAKTESAKEDDKTVKDVYDSMSEEQKNVVAFMVGQALEDEKSSDSDDSAEHSELTTDNLNDFIQHSIQEGFNEMRNVFEQNGSAAESNTLSHAQIEAVFNDAKKMGSFKESMLMHAAEYGFDQIDTLFPDAKALANTPEMISRQMEWVREVISGTKHSPFSRIKSVTADITADEARARGYVKGNLKKEEIIKLLSRKTLPTTIYKKQKLDRDDILDITDFDVVAWLKAEMRLMLDEELARAVLVGDGRDGLSEDKIDEDSIRPISKDDPMYAHPVTVAAGASVEDTIEQLIRGRANYRGSGQPVFFTTQPFLTDMLLTKDKVGRRVYESLTSLSAALMVSKIVTVEVMEQEQDLLGIFVNLNDYTIGSDKGGNVSMFDDFDIDYNQHKYLIETRVSGALTKPKSAVVVKRAEGILVTPVSPSFDGATNTITFPDTTGVEYTIEGIPVTGSEVITSTTDVEARPAAGYSFTHGSVTHWTFVYNAG